MYWRKGRQTVPTGEGKFRLVDGGSLQIVGVSREDEGRYDAFADNGLGVSSIIIISFIIFINSLLIINPRCL